MFKELPILECENEVTKTTKYLILALTAYKATAEAIFDILLNVTIVCQIFNQAFAEYGKIQEILMESLRNLHTYQKRHQYFPDAVARRIL